MRLYFAATNTFSKDVDLSKTKYALTTFMEGEKACQNTIDIVGRNNFLMDSGAYSFMNAYKGKKIDFMEYQKKYIEFINKADVKYFFNIDIDTLIGIEKTKQMRDILEKETNKKCIPVWHKCMGLEEWKKLTKEYDYVAMGTMQEIRPYPSIIKKLNKIAKDNKCKVHGLGFTPKDMNEYGFFSVDSTSWFQGARWGSIEKFDGKKIIKVVNRNKNQRIKNRKAILKHNYEEWIKYQLYLSKGE